MGCGRTLCSEVCSTSWKGAGSILALLKSTNWSSCCSSHSRIWGGAIGQGKGYGLPTGASKGPPILPTPSLMEKSGLSPPTSPCPPHALAPLWDVWDPSEKEGPACLCPTPHLCWGHLVTQNHLLLQERCVGAALRVAGGASARRGAGRELRGCRQHMQAGYRRGTGSTWAGQVT